MDMLPASFLRLWCVSWDTKQKPPPALCCELKGKIHSNMFKVFLDKLRHNDVLSLVATFVLDLLIHRFVDAYALEFPVFQPI